jgi:hypothetical protein
MDIKCEYVNIVSYIIMVVLLLYYKKQCSSSAFLFLYEC